jgi:hypothetical protein
MTADWFSEECHCGAEIEFPADADGLVFQDEAVWCLECGCANHIDIQESAESDVGTASATTDEYRVINVAQPRCNGVCGACPEYLRHEPLCRLNCERVPVTCRESAAARIAEGETP